MVGYKFDENNAGIIGCLYMYTSIITELSGAKMAECNETIAKH